MSVSLQVDLSGVDRLAKRLERLRHLDTRTLLDEVGAAVESQTRRRITDEKEGPDGTPWPAWSPGYAETRHAGHSLLVGEGDLGDSVTYAVGLGGDFVEAGTNLIYGAIHQFGGQAGRKRAATIPARPYLGLSEGNESELASLVDDWADRQMESL
ncbi:phage virion morphogenesis protein [Desulfocurvibacter africanus]|uniref:Phage virion morphogenesis protein n=1 Tax=Desulfocurvibacter africanus subsp. africanus str. Walvis Bay TaxID=690850 RepID=F3YW17_DESAF|nr:phage virion morphogenesis protein [Desulfocurvibacter africanus]EGJ49047.1 phage virion morphogenesis protein [Desulfocurvibacter africanus subsp. africanus str. Walvis Bay]